MPVAVNVVALERMVAGCTSDEPENAGATATGYLDGSATGTSALSRIATQPALASVTKLRGHACQRGDRQVVAIDHERACPELPDPIGHPASRIMAVGAQLRW